MGLTLLNQLGEWNPQLFRELKGLFKPRHLLLTVASSLVCQVLLLITFSQENCLKYADSQCVQSDWQIRWSFVFTTLNCILPFLLLVFGVYQIISDLAKEERLGTLNFIRLSPQSSQSILLGKILGVPALLYLGIGLAIPLHGVSALAAKIPLSWLLSIYALWGVGCCFFYVTSCCYTLAWSSHSEPKSLAGLGSLLAFTLGLPYIILINVSFALYQSNVGLGNWDWFGLPLGSQLDLMLSWTLITLSVGTYWIWQASNRLFRNPSGTLVSKSQSYWLVASFQLWLLGFVVPQLNSAPSNTQFVLGVAVLFGLNPIAFVLLNEALSPRRQALLDWTRYRHKSNSSSKGVWNRSLMQDLIWGEKSPTLVAIAINLLITTAIWVPWILLGLARVEDKGQFTTLTALLGLFLTMNLILIYAALSQLMVFITRSQRMLTFVGMGGTFIVLPLVIGAVLGIEPLQIPFVWIFSPVPVLALVKGSIPTIFLGWLAQLSILVLLTFQLTRQLRKAGESASKSLFPERSALPISRLK